MLFDDTAVALRAKRIDLENVGIAMAEGGINGDGEIVIEVLGEIAAELRGDDGAGGRVVTMDTDVEVARVVEDADFAVFGGGLGFERFALAEVGDERGIGPERVVERAIEARGVFDAGGGGAAGGGGRRLGVTAMGRHDENEEEEDSYEDSGVWRSEAHVCISKRVGDCASWRRDGDCLRNF